MAQIEHIRFDIRGLHPFARELREPERLRHLAGTRAVVARGADDTKHA